MKWRPVTAEPVTVALVTGASVVAIVAMAASAVTLAVLGVAVGLDQWGGWQSWSLPVSVDVLAAVAGLVWLAGPEAARGLGQWLTAGSVAASVVLNATGHLVATHHVTVGAPLVIAVSAVPPVAAALALHLAAAAARTTPVATPDGQEADPGHPVATPAPEDEWSVTEDDPWPPRTALPAEQVATPAVTVAIPDDQMATPDDDPETTLATLHARGTSQAEASRITGIPRSTVRRRYAALDS